ncbi:MAG: chondroitinase-B domain-containing protein, partial [Saprospiraceae bacterium]|nr:chondroitinase-B domain-containing protein [Saprospiraceae bacterium]
GSNRLTFGDGEGNQFIDFRWNVVPDMLVGTGSDRSLTFWRERDSLGSLVYGNYVINGNLELDTAGRENTNLEFSGNYFNGTYMSLGGSTIQGTNNQKINVQGSGWGNLGDGLGDYVAPSDMTLFPEPPPPPGDWTYGDSYMNNVDARNSHEVNEEPWCVVNGKIVCGVDVSTIGPDNDTPTTVGTQATTSNYQSVIAAANPGDTILLRAGTYSAANINIPAGTAGNPITVRNYNGESVQLNGRLTFNNNYTAIRGVTIHGQGDEHAVFINRASSSALHHIEVSYCQIWRAKGHNLNITRHVEQVRAHHNIIDGGTKGNDDNAVRIGHESSGWEPNWIELDHNLIQLLWSGQNGGGSDGLTLYGHHRVYVHHNNFRHIEGNSNVENAVDIKPPFYTTGNANYCEFMYNWIAGSEIPNKAMCIFQGDGADRMHAWWNWWEGNRPITLGDWPQNAGHVDWRWNMIPDITGSGNTIRFWDIQNTPSIWYGNYLNNSQLDMNDHDSHDIEVSGNYFNGTDLALGSSTGIAGTNNVKINVTGSGWGAIGSGPGDYVVASDFELLGSTSDPDPY